VQEKVKEIVDIEELKKYFKTVEGYGIEVHQIVIERSKEIKAAGKK
jgi:hypothetical protein